MLNKLLLFSGLSLFGFAAHAVLGVPISEATDIAVIQSHTVVLLNTEDPGKHSRCTGTLIGRNIVLTAAHCIPVNFKKDLSVVTSIYEFTLSERKPVVRVVAHPQYFYFDIPKLNLPNYDIALVQFQGDLPASYQPTTWSKNSLPSLDQFWLYVAGYGGSRPSDATDFGEFRTGYVAIENNLFLQRQSYMTGNQSNGKGICKGDSGGPAYVKTPNGFELIGLTSAIQNGCTGTSYFNRTSFYSDWISAALVKLVTP